MNKYLQYILPLLIIGGLAKSYKDTKLQVSHQLVENLTLGHKIPTEIKKKREKQYQQTGKFQLNLTNEGLNTPYLADFKEMVYASKPIISNYMKDKGIFDVQGIIDYMKTIKYKEGLKSMCQLPEMTIKFGTGDCDDMAILFSTMLAVIGEESVFVKFDSKTGNDGHGILGISYYSSGVSSNDIYELNGKKYIFYTAVNEGMELVKPEIYNHEFNAEARNLVFIK